MATLTQPPVPKPFIEIFEKAGIKIRHYSSAEAFESDLMDFLRGNRVLHLSTCRDNMPRVTPLDYRLVGLSFCILSAGGVKFANLEANDRVCVSIAEPYDADSDFWSYRGLQAWGRAEVISRKKSPAEFDQLIGEMHVLKTLAQLGITELRPEMNYRIIRVIPDSIKYNNPRKGIFRVTWDR